MAAVKKASAADILRLGQQVAGVKANTNPKTWASFVKNAHKRGFTVAGALSGSPDTLKERTQSSLKDQAAKSIATAYAPAEKQLDDSRQQILNLDVKRQADNKAYEAWLAGQISLQDAQAKAADDQVAGVASTIQQQTRDAWTTTQKGALADAASSPGNVSDPNQSNALNFANPANASIGHAGAAASEANTQTGAAQAARQLVNGALAGQMQASKVAQQSETNKALQGVVDDQTKLGIQKAQDQAGAFDKLVSQEIDKATNNANLGVAADKLNVSLKETNAKIAASAKTADKNRTSANQRAAATVAVQKAKLALDRGKSDLNSDGKVDAKDYALKKQIDAKYGASGSGKTTSGDKKVSQAQYQKVSSALDELTRLHSVSKQPASSFRHRLETLGFSGPQIDLAESLRVNGGKLTPRARKIATNLGILLPDKIWPSAG